MLTMMKRDSSLAVDKSKKRLTASPGSALTVFIWEGYRKSVVSVVVVWVKKGRDEQA